MYFVIGFIIGSILGFIIGFIIACIGELLVEKRAVAERIVKLDGKYYTITERNLK